MSLLQNVLHKFKEKKQKFREADEDMKINRLVSERQKNANERELERFIEEERQKKISTELIKFRKARQKESMRTTVFDGKNLFKGQKNIFANHTNMMMNNQGGLFFK